MKDDNPFDMSPEEQAELDKREAFHQRMRLAVAVAPIVVERAVPGARVHLLASDINKLVRAIIQELEK